MKFPIVRTDVRSIRNFKRLLRENVRLSGGTATFSSRAIDLLATITKDFGFSLGGGTPDHKRQLVRDSYWAPPLGAPQEMSWHPR